MHIEIWSDFICPFCYIGKKQLESALDNFSHRDDVNVTFKSYQLDPNTPEYNGKNYYENLGQKFGSIEKAKQMAANIQAQAKTVGMEFDFDHAKVANTRLAHRLNKLAEKDNMQASVSEHLFRGHFIEGKDIGDTEVLLTIAKDAGLDPAKAKQVLEDDSAYEDAVQTDLNEAQQFGITGVPYVIINRKYALSGAQPEEVFAQALEKVWIEENEQTPLQDLSTAGNSGDACGIDGCETPDKDEA